MAKNFYFAWVDEGTAFDPDVHNVEDEDVFSFKMEQSEGDFAGLEVVIRNPRVGFLKPGRKVWAWFSMNMGTDITPDPVPLFLGRLIGVPTNIFDTLVTLSFTARPADFVEQKTALATAMKVLPYYDPIFVSPDAWLDPDVVLEGYTVHWHIDPVTHVVSVSDVLLPEDGTIDLSEDDIFYDSFSVTLQQVPLKSCSVTATIPFTQKAQGIVDITPLFRPFGSGGTLQSYTMDGLISDWPKQGESVGEGWVAYQSSLEDATATAGKPFITIGPNAGQVSPLFDLSLIGPLSKGTILFPVRVSGELHSGVGEAGFSFDYEMVGATLGYGIPEMVVEYTRATSMGQIVTFTMRTAMQDIVTAAGDDESILLTLNANSVTDPTEDLSIPIGDIRRRDYVYQPRGLQSVAHLVMLARANLVMRSRAVQTTWQMPLFATEGHYGLEFTLRKGALVHDHRLPGGEAAGKVISYTHSLDGDTGEAVSVITIGSAVGFGGSHTPESFTGVYAEPGYMAAGYQKMEGGTTLLPSSDVQYSYIIVPPQDDGLDFERGLSARSVVRLLTVENNYNVQAGLIQGVSSDKFGDQTKIAQELQDHPTQFSLLLKSMKTGPFAWETPITVSDLIVPKQIDLEADSV